MPRYSISNAPTEVVGLYAGSGVFSGRLGDNHHTKLVNTDSSSAFRTYT